MGHIDRYRCLVCNMETNNNFCTVNFVRTQLRWNEWVSSLPSGTYCWSIIFTLQFNLFLLLVYSFLLLLPTVIFSSFCFPYSYDDTKCSDLYLQEFVLSLVFHAFFPDLTCCFWFWLENLWLVNLRLTFSWQLVVFYSAFIHSVVIYLVHVIMVTDWRSDIYLSCLVHVFQIIWFVSKNVLLCKWTIFADKEHQT